ncbi:MAG: hypothetical protein U0528_15280 [Anaerolineae bacterium]
MKLTRPEVPAAEIGVGSPVTSGLVISLRAAPHFTSASGSPRFRLEQRQRSLDVTMMVVGSMSAMTGRMAGFGFVSRAYQRPTSPPYRL